MIPSDYRLQNVANSLIARLEGTRRSYVDDPTAAGREFARIAEDHVEAACAEMRDVGMAEEEARHSAFLDEEIHQTFLPRYTRLATRMTAQEAHNFGLGALGEPLGRAGLVLAALFGFVLFLRWIYLPWAWPLFLVDLSLPLWPDIARMLVRRRYAAELQDLLDDLAAVQDQAATYAPSTSLADEPLKPRPRQRESH